MSHIRYLHTTDGITVVLDGKPYSVSSRSKYFEEFSAALTKGVDSTYLRGIVEREALAIQRLVHQQLTPNLKYDEGTVTYRGTALRNYAVERLAAMVEQGLSIGPLAAFVDKQQENPDPVVIEHLYKFLEFGKIPLTPDGDFLAYKAVRADYKDIHSGTFLNSVGERPSVPRPTVDPDRDRTCSRGLHVCSYAYLPNFSHADGHVMMCKVSPFHVVAIPSDYNNTKMRVCEYEVVGEVTSYYRRGEDVLADGVERVAGERFVVHYEHELGAKEVYDNFYTLDEACEAADEMDYVAWVVDLKSGDIVHRSEE